GDSNFKRVKPDTISKQLVASVAIPTGRESATLAGFQIRLVTPPGITAFDTTDSTITPGSPATLNWRVEPGVTALAIDNGIGNVTALTSNNTGTLTLDPGPSRTTTYTLTTSSTEGTDSKSLTVQTGAAPLINSFTTSINPDDVDRSRLLFWNVTGASSLEIDHGIGPVSATGDTNLTIVPKGATWRYLDDGSDQGTAWTTAGFDDSTWESGPAQLGYGENDEQTSVGFGPSSSQKFATTYFRHTFNFNAGQRASSLSLDLKYDDGAVVHLNGTELDRYNMPATPVVYTTYASATVSGDGSNFATFPFPPDLLRNGKNVVAVEVHQANASSSDISFDLGLAATIQGGLVVSPPGNRTYTLTASNAYGTSNATVEVVLSAVPLVLYDFSTSPPLDTLANSTSSVAGDPPLGAPQISPRPGGGNALTFLPSNPVKISSPSLFPGLSTHYALSLWLNSPASETADATLLHASSLQSGFTLSRLNQSQLAIATHHPTGPQTTLVDGFFDGTWHHLAISLEPSSITVYQDGLQIHESTLEDAAITPSTTWSLGDSPSTSAPFTGQVDELVVFDRQLQPDDLATLLDNGAASLLLPLVIGYSASDQTVVPGDPVTLSWTTHDATSVSLDPHIPGDLPLNGSTTVTPSTDTTYTLTAHNPYGSVSLPLTVTTGAAPAITSFTASPDTLTTLGQTATLSWSTVGATSNVIDNRIGDVTGQTDITVTPTSLTRYQLTATNDFGSTTASTTIAVTNDPAPGAWTLAVIPDTQHYIKSATNSRIVTQMTSWIAANAAARNIKFVIHEGDLVQNNTAVEWARARTSMDVLDGVVPYAVTNGNHDYGPGGNSSNRSTLFNAPTAFGPGSTYAAQPTLNGNYPEPGEPNSLESTYHTFHANGQDYLVISLEWAPRDAVVDWANTVADQFPNHRKILLVHAYTYDDNTRFNWASRGSGQSGSPYAYGISSLPGGINDGEQLWQKLVRKHEGFSLVCSGHADTVGYVRSAADHGNIVHQILFNTQTEANGGNGWIRLLEFHEDGLTVDVKTYSPYFDSRGLNPWRTDRRNQFSMQLSAFPAADSDADGQPDAWELTHGLDPDNPDDATLDANADGLSNLAAYAFGNNPNSAAPAPLPLSTSINPENGRPTVTYRRRIAGSSTLTYTLQKSADLITWAPLDTTTASVSNNGDNTETVTLTDPSPGTGETVYYRLEIARP
ncbi:MAG: hypothetical protein P8J87_21670, partial [Verrucomicrobiales bacterium]|nr:hypothetical protein [Verrucomicrobiales bacterium]